MELDKSVQAMQVRLKALEDEKNVSACMNRYMKLCDVLDVGFDLKLLADLFTEDATWEGKGSRYAKTFGRYEGRDAIMDMFAKYTKPPAHFELNVHFLANEIVTVDGSTATASWVLLQPSSFSTGKSQLSCARITATFKEEDQGWKISAFQTENLFSRPVNSPWDHNAPLPVPE